LIVAGEMIGFGVAIDQLANQMPQLAEESKDRLVEMKSLSV